MTSELDCRRYREHGVSLPGLPREMGESPGERVCRPEDGSLGCGSQLASSERLAIHMHHVAPLNFGLLFRREDSTACLLLMPSHLALADRFGLFEQPGLQMGC